MKIIVHVVLALSCLLTAGPSFAKEEGPGPSFVQAEGPQITRKTVLRGLESPWDIAFGPGGEMLFTEKCRGLSVRKADGKVARLFGTAGSALVAPDAFCEGQTGFHGVTLDPDFANNRSIYLYMPSRAADGMKTNHVIRLRVNDDFTSVSDRQDIITDINYKNRDNAWGKAGSHSGGRIQFGPDGYLYVTTGDNHNGTLPQDLNQLGGKVLRVDRDGQAAPGNGTSGDPRIFTYGHRNVQGLSFHPVTGQAFVSEHGPKHSDEVTALIAGGNGGWDPKPEAGVSCADNYCGYISNKPDGTLTPMTDISKLSNVMQPVYVLKQSEGLGPCTFIVGDKWKSWNGALAIGVLKGQRVDFLRLNEDGEVASLAKAKLPSERIRAVVMGPDQALFVATDSGSIWQVSPK